MNMCHYYCYNVTFLSGTITNHLSVYYPYMSGRLLLSDVVFGRLGTFSSPLLSDEVGPYGGFQSC